MKNLFIFLISSLFTATIILGNDLTILDERDWTSKDGRAIRATLLKAQEKSITLRMAKGDKTHTVEIDTLSLKDQLLIADHRDRALDLVNKHNAKVKTIVWYADWHFRNQLSTVPELEIDEIRLVYHFGMERDLGIFAVKLTPTRFKADSNKLTALIMGTEGFAVKAKAASGWIFMESGQELVVKPRATTKGSSEKAETVYANGVNVRLLFPNGRSIGEGVVGLDKCLILTLENFEPRSLR